MSVLFSRKNCQNVNKIVVHTLIKEKIGYYLDYLHFVIMTMPLND